MALFGSSSYCFLCCILSQAKSAHQHTIFFSQNKSIVQINKRSCMPLIHMNFFPMAIECPRDIRSAGLCDVRRVVVNKKIGESSSGSGDKRSFQSGQPPPERI
jgi:hypothetical protein